MLKNILIIVIGGIIVISALTFNKLYEKRAITAMNYKDVEYVIEGERVKLDGTKTRYFGNLAKGDFNGDGIPDLAFIVTQSPGGSGTFYYVVAALQNAQGGYAGTNAIFLGDRIAPQTTEFQNGRIIVNYADRKEGEPMTAIPSVGTSRYFEIQGEIFVENTSNPQ